MRPTEIGPSNPHHPGHEGPALLRQWARGPGVKEGDPVGLAWLNDACGACEYCITGWETLCERPIECCGP